jgi:hypothetical protein
MTDYPALYQRLYQEVIKAEKTLDASADAFMTDFIKTLQAEGWEINDKAQAKLDKYFAAIKTNIATGITTANSLVLGGSMASQEVLKLTEAAFSRTWQDGKTLSDRLWVLNQDMQQGLKKVLKDGVAQGKSANALIYEMQRSFERDGREKFVEQYVTREDWTSDLFKSGQNVIKNPAMRKDWERTVSETKQLIEKLQKTGTRTAAEQTFKQMLKAVETGNEALLSSALKWWGYDKQLYYLKRIARTEMANAAHNAVIDSTIENPVIIGYQWRLSGTHPVYDICDMYANVDMGLGKGVFTKEKVPRAKAHPHCMCTITPRVTQIKTAGNVSFEELTKAIEK